MAILLYVVMSGQMSHVVCAERVLSCSEPARRMQQLPRLRTHVEDGEGRRSASKEVDSETKQCDPCHSAGQQTSREAGHTRRTVERYNVCLIDDYVRSIERIPTLDTSVSTCIIIHIIMTMIIIIVIQIPCDIILDGWVRIVSNNCICGCKDNISNNTKLQSNNATDYP